MAPTRSPQVDRKIPLRAASARARPGGVGLRRGLMLDLVASRAPLAVQAVPLGSVERTQWREHGE
jgi:hypothetical protein